MFGERDFLVHLLPPTRGIVCAYEFIFGMIFDFCISVINFLRGVVYLFWYWFVFNFWGGRLIAYMHVRSVSISMCGPHWIAPKPFGMMVLYKAFLYTT